MNTPKEPDETGGFVIRYHEYLEEFSDAVAALRAEAVGLYRWVHNPLAPDDEPFDPDFCSDMPLIIDNLSHLAC